MKFDNAEKLRNHILNSLELLSKQKIDVDEMSIISKSAEVVFSSVKLQLTYSVMLGEQPDIAFLQDCHAVQKNQNVLENGIKKIE